MAGEGRRFSVIPEARAQSQRIMAGRAQRGRCWESGLFSQLPLPGSLLCLSPQAGSLCSGNSGAKRMEDVLEPLSSGVCARVGLPGGH